MAYRVKSLLSNKMAQALQRLSSNGREVNPVSLLPYIKVDIHTKDPPEFKISLKDLQQNNLLYTSDESVLKFGSSLVERFDTDQEVSAVYVRQSKTDVKLNFKVSGGPLVSDVIGTVTERPMDFWRSSELVRMIPQERVVVEYSSPNIAKPFHVGHLRSTIIGNFISNVNTAMGHSVARINYLGDWGTQFGLLKYGYDKQNLTEEDLKENAISKLHSAYVWANQRAEEDPEVTQAARETFTRMEEGDAHELETWDLFRRVSIEDLKRTYERLNVTFDHYDGESMYPKAACDGILREMNDLGLLRNLDDGRKVYEVSPGREVTLEKSDGSTLYLTRDIAAAVDRFARHRFTRMLYVVENGQSDHFTALFRILGTLGHQWTDGLRHVKFGRVKGMSSRKGTSVALDVLIDGTHRVMEQRQQQTKTTKYGDGDGDGDGESSLSSAEELAVSSVIVRDLKQRRHRDYEFSWDKALQASGSTGVRLQYVHCRLVNLEKNCGVKHVPGANTAPLVEQQALALAQEIARFDEVLLETYRELEACILLAYLFRLCSVTNVAIKHLQVKSAPKEVAEARLALFMAARHTLRAGMDILGLRPLSYM